MVPHSTERVVDPSGEEANWAGWSADSVDARACPRRPRLRRTWLRLIVVHALAALRFYAILRRTALSEGGVAVAIAPIEAFFAYHQGGRRLLERTWQGHGILGHVRGRAGQAPGGSVFVQVPA